MFRNSKSIYERFTDRAHKAMQLANQEAQRLNHEYIGTEHILLGLVKEGAGIAAKVLNKLDVNLRKIRLQIDKLIQPGPTSVYFGRLPKTPRARKVIEYAVEEARNLNHSYVGTEHLLLGLIREEEGLGAQVLRNLRLKIEKVREEVLEVLSHTGDSQLSQIRDRILREYDIYVPVTAKDGQSLATEKMAGIKQRLRDRFGGVQTFFQTIDGTVKIGQMTIGGELIVLRVATGVREEATEFLRSFREELKAELDLDDILIVRREAEVL